MLQSLTKRTLKIVLFKSKKCEGFKLTNFREIPVSWKSGLRRASTIGSKTWIRNESARHSSLSLTLPKLKSTIR